SCSTCSASVTCATTTDRGPSGATASGSRSPAGTTRDGTEPPASPAAGDRRRLHLHGGRGPAAAPAGVLPGAAGPAGALRRPPRPDGAGPGVPDAAVPGRGG